MWKIRRFHLSMKCRRKRNSGEESKVLSNDIRILWPNRKVVSLAMPMYRFSMRERPMTGPLKHLFMWIKTANAAAAASFYIRSLRKF